LSKASFDIEIFKLDSISVKAEVSACQNEVPFPVSIYPNGGTITCAVVVGQTFYPAFASLKYTKVLYTLNDQHNCRIKDSTMVYISENPKVSIAPFERVYDNEKVLTVSGATPADSGRYYVDDVVAANFDPAARGKGLYTIEYRVVNYFGCRDSISTKIRVNSSPIKPLISVLGDDLVSNAAKGNQWMNKNGDIVGQKLSVFTPTKDGYYYVKVTNDSNCSNDSDSVLFKKQVGLWRMLKTRISIYPNPSKTGIFYVRGLNGEAKISVSDVLGREVYTDYIFNTIEAIDLRKLNVGTYYMTIEFEGQSSAIRVIILE